MCETEMFLNIANVTPLLEREFKARPSIGGILDPNYVLNECFWFNDNQVIPINDPKIDLSDIYLVHDEDFVVNNKKGYYHVFIKHPDDVGWHCYEFLKPETVQNVRYISIPVPSYPGCHRDKVLKITYNYLVKHRQK